MIVARRRGTRRVVVVVVVALTLFGVLATGAAAANDESATPVRRVLVLSVPDLAWDDLDFARLPNLQLLLEESGVADLSVRGVRRHPTLGDGYVTLGAGTRAVGRTLDEGQCLNAEEAFEEGLAGEAFARRAGVPSETVPAGSVVCLAQPAIAERNSRLLFDAEIGALGDALADAGIDRAVIGNADQREPAGGSGFQRMVGLSLADANGLVPGGNVAPELLVLDPAAPFGVRADTDAYVAAFEEAWRDRTVVVVEASDLVRFASYREFLSPAARSATLDAILVRFDEMVGRLLESVDRERDAVMLVGPSYGGNRARLAMASLRAPGIEPGLLRSGWTRRSGVVSIVDVAPTILAQLGVETPGAMEGRPFEVGRDGGSFEDRVEWMVETDAAAQFRDRMIPQVTGWFVALQIVLVLAAILVMRYAGLRALAAVELGALTLLGFLPATYLAGLFSFHDLPMVLYWAWVLGLGFLIGAVAWLVTDRVGPGVLIVVLTTVVGVLAIDLVFFGAVLQFNTSLGYSPTVAGRFAGIGNLAYSQLAAGALLLAGLVAHVIGGRKGVWVAIAIMGAAVIVDGTPSFGSDVGGVLSMVPAYAVTALLLLGVQLRWRWVALGCAAAVALLGVFALLDLSQPADERTHLGRLVERTGSGGWDAFSTVIERKLAANLDVLFSSVWTLMIPVVVVALAYVIYLAPGRLQGIYDRIPTMRATLAGFFVLGALGFAVNDSGIAVPGVMLGVLTPVLLVLLVRGERAGAALATGPEVRVDVEHEARVPEPAP